MVSGGGQHRVGSSRLRSGRSASDLGTPLQEPTPNILSLTLTNPMASSLVDSGEPHVGLCPELVRARRHRVLPTAEVSPQHPVVYPD